MVQITIVVVGIKIYNIIKMKTLLNYIKESLLFEGGNAIKSSNPIPAYIAPLVYKEIEDKIKNWKSGMKFAPIGSLGKKADDQFTGDIDIAISLSKDEVIKMVEEIFPDYELNKFTSNKVVSLGYPYDINGKSGIAQIDFMFDMDIEWAKWRFSSPDLKNGESKYKATPKVYLIQHIVSCIPVKDMETEYFDSGEVKRRWRYTFNQEGVFKYLAEYINKQKGKNYGKPKKSADKLFYEFVTNDPQNVMKFIFGDNEVDPKIFNTVEKLWDAIHSDLWPWGDEVLGKVEERWDKEYIHGNGMKEYPVDPEDFKYSVYKPNENK